MHDHSVSIKLEILIINLYQKVKIFIRYANFMNWYVAYIIHLL